MGMDLQVGSGQQCNCKLQQIQLVHHGNLGYTELASGQNHLLGYYYHQG